MKTKSFVKEIIKYLSLLMMLLIVAQGIFLGSSYALLKKEMKSSSQAFLTLYRNEGMNDIQNMDNIIKDIANQSEDLAKIKGDNADYRSLSAVSLYNYLQKLMTQNNVLDEMVVYDKTYDVSVDAKSSYINMSQKNKLREYTALALNNKEIKSFEWNFVTIDKEIYLYKMILSKTTSIAIYVKTNRLLESLSMQRNGSRSMVLANTHGFIGKVWGKETALLKDGNNIAQIESKKYDVLHKDIAEHQLRFYCYTDKKDIFSQTHASMVVVAMVVFCALFFLFFILKFTRKEIANPMKSMIRDMEKIKNGEYDNRINVESHTDEFKLFQETTNQMVDEIVGLKIQSYEKKISLQDMELRSIKLQLKPHFFLNALTTISSLAAQGKTKEVQTYIEALSKNVRYMFQAGFHTIRLKEEMKHVNNYFEMQELKYPDCIFYMIDVPEELSEWKIPQMLIHTFIENEYKYAVSMDSILTLLIKVRKEMYDGEEMLLIEIEDDGNGYPKEVLDQLYEPTKDAKNEKKKRGERIGLYSIKRMLELMYERDNLLLIGNTKPHGCHNKIYLPKQPKHEL